jgi:hypothetical protein
MRVVDDEVLSLARSVGRCEKCGRRLYPLSPHHCFIKRGMGGGRRLDLPENIASLCEIPCHNAAEHSEAFNEEVREIVAKRVGTTAQAILEWLWLCLRTDKAGPIPPRPWEGKR